MELYDSKKWENKRQSTLRRDGYICQVSKRYGIYKEATLVHHIFPVDEFPEYAFKDWNLISLCLKEHNRLHDRTTNQLTKEGRDLLIKTATKHGIPIPERYKTYDATIKGRRETRARYT